MQNFTFSNPTKILFGKGRIAELSKEIPKSAKVLITYGGGSVLKNGTLQEVREALKNHVFLEFSGIEPNPTYETLMKAVAIARAEKIDFLLAVGGGSVLDGTKFIAAAIPFVGEPWDILEKHAKITSAIPLAGVLTLPATGSEMNGAAVISKKATTDKLSFIHPFVFPKFSILDPTKTYSLPKNQTGNGVVDAFVHIAEQYFTHPVSNPVQDRFAEGLFLTLIEEGPRVLGEPQNYDHRANVMWAATMALNGVIGVGVPQDWATHGIGHEITALYGLDHAQTLAIILPAMLHIQRAEKREKILQYGARVWGITEGDENTKIDQAIANTRTFFEEMGVPTRFSDYKIGKEAIEAVVAQLSRHGITAMGERGTLSLPKIKEVLKHAL